LLTIIVPLIAFAVLAWTFSSAVVRGLDVAVVDADRSEVSAKLIQSIASAPGLRVAERANDLKSATGAIRSGRAIAAVYIPPRFEQDLLAIRRPQIIAFYNAQYFTPGNIASRALSEAILDATSKLSAVHGVRLPSVGSGALVVEQYVLTNPALNYAGFLLRAVMPTTLHVVIAIATAYAIGTEFSRRIPPDTEREVLRGHKARIPAYVDSAYFLVFNRTLQGIAEGPAIRTSLIFCAACVWTAHGPG
jgi:ABC-2 type transport system permease protein